MPGLAQPTHGVSVVVPTKYRSAALARCLRALVVAADRVGEPLEVIVLDDGEEDTVRRLLAEESTRDGVSVRYVPRRAYGGDGPVRGRDYGVREARYDIVAFTDDDTVCDPEWLERGVRRLRASPELAGLEGAVVPDVVLPLDAVRARVVQSRAGGAFLTANMILRRAAVVQAGGFQRLWDERLLTGRLHFREDSDLALRVRDRVGPVPFDPALVVRHPVDQPGLRSHLHTARFFALDAPFEQLHPGAIPSFRVAPLTRVRIRAACTALAALPLLCSRRTRAAGLAIIGGCTVGVSLQVERDLRAAGFRRACTAELHSVTLRLPRSLLWCLVAGASRLAGVVLLRSRLVSVRPDGASRRPSDE